MRELRFFELNMLCARITLFWAKHGMCENHALSGEISYRKSRMTRSENYYPTLPQSLEYQIYKHTILTSSSSSLFYCLLPFSSSSTFFLFLLFPSFSVTQPSKSSQKTDFQHYLNPASSKMHYVLFFISYNLIFSNVMMTKIAIIRLPRIILQMQIDFSRLTNAK